jgi:hypothetical protein
MMTLTYFTAACLLVVDKACESCLLQLFSSFPTSTAVPTEHWLDSVDRKYYCDDDDVVVVDDDDDDDDVAILLGSRTCCC